VVVLQSGAVALAQDASVPEIHPRIFSEHFLDQLRRHLIKAETQEIEAGAEVDQRYLVRQPSWDFRRGVQRDRLPNQIGTLGRHTMLRAELASGIRAIHLKPIVSAARKNQAEVVQDGAAKRSFLIDHRTTEAPDSKAAEIVGSKTMSAEKLGRTGFQQVDGGGA
jgi:hypothetical protein